MTETQCNEQHEASTPLQLILCFGKDRTETFDLNNMTIKDIMTLLNDTLTMIHDTVKAERELAFDEPVLFDESDLQELPDDPHEARQRIVKVFIMLVEMYKKPSSLTN